MKIYTVTMHRHGDREADNYLHGIFSDADAALEAAEDEITHRHGNYLPYVLEWDMADGQATIRTNEPKIIRNLPDQMPFIKKRLAEYKRRKEQSKL